jgi:hypothetical protein
MHLDITKTCTYTQFVHINYVLTHISGRSWETYKKNNDKSYKHAFTYITSIYYRVDNVLIGCNFDVILFAHFNHNTIQIVHLRANEKKKKREKKKTQITICSVINTHTIKKTKQRRLMGTDGMANLCWSLSLQIFPHRCVRLVTQVTLRLVPWNLLMCACGTCISYKEYQIHLPLYMLLKYNKS